MTGPATAAGALLAGPGRTRFRFWAPGCDPVLLEVEGQPPQGMATLGDGWFGAEADCSAGARYRFRLSNDLAVPDPASRAQDGDVHGWSVVVDQSAYDWRNDQWRGRPWHEAVICEVHAGVMGGFAGVAKALPDLAALGITAIELMPIGAFSGKRNWGYDGVLPYAPAAAYGSPDDLKALVDSAHDLGLMIFLDVVYNHFGPDGNYLHAYAPAFFDESRHTPWGGAIDFRQEAVARFFIDNALYWLNDYRFDGLRLDAVHAMADDDFLDRLAREVRGGVDPARHVHLVLENEANDAARLERGYDAQWNDDFHNVLHVLLTGETQAYYRDFADRPADRLAHCLAEGFIYQGEGSPNHDGRPRGTASGHLPPVRFVTFLQNHDQIGNRALGERLTMMVDKARLRAAMGLLLLCPQIPLLFMGEETGSRSPFLFFTDFHDELADAVREGRRREFAAFPAFADPEARKRIPDPNAMETFTSSIPAPGPDAAEWRDFITTLLRLRAQHIVPGLAGAAATGASALSDAAVIAHWRLANGARLTLAINLGEQGVKIVNAPTAGPLHVIGSEPRDDMLAPASCIAWLGHEG